MLKFNNNHIFTGYLKQLLAEFNLPTCRVYSAENYEYFLEHKKEKNILSTFLVTDDDVKAHARYFPYIKNDAIMYYINGHWESLTTANTVYYYNKKELNHTKNLKIWNNIYDSYTHEYLGNFLRFQRDYLGIDLMPLYNCFSNRVCSKLYNHFPINTATKPADLSYATFDTDDSAYKIYMLPVKLFKNYTIAIDCDSQIELYCDIYGKYQESTSTRTKKNREALYRLTYKSLNHCKFNQPILYTNLVTLVDQLTSEQINAMELGQKEDNLKLFIKLPANNKSSITVLEGNYLNWNDTILQSGYPILKFNKDNNDFEASKSNFYGMAKISNHFVTNYEGPVDSKHISCRQNPCIEVVKFNDHIGYQDSQIFKPITSLQLLSLNTGESYPFADRLIEYLVGNVIANDESLEDNIKRVQKVIELNGQANPENTTNQLTYYGAWENKIRPILYDYFNEDTLKVITDQDTTVTALVPNKLNTGAGAKENLGYVNKDIEKQYAYKEKTANGTIISSVSISGIDIYENEGD